MIRRFLRNGAQKFGRRHGYDVSYMLHVIDGSTAAGLRLALFPLATQHAGPRTAGGLRAGAMLASTLDGDCGPCVQLVLDMASEGGVPPELLSLCVEGRSTEAGDVGLGFRFAQAAISGAPELEALRDEIEKRHGADAVTAASFAAASGRFYPVLKRGLGFAETCSRLRIGDRDVGVARQA